MGRGSTRRALCLMAGTASFAACGFHPQVESGVVACKPGGADCCPAGYVCVGKGAVTAAGISPGSCWSKDDLSLPALAATHDDTPTVSYDPACMVTDWLPEGMSWPEGGGPDAGGRIAVGGPTGSGGGITVITIAGTGGTGGTTSTGTGGTGGSDSTSTSPSNTNNLGMTVCTETNNRNCCYMASGVPRCSWMYLRQNKMVQITSGYNHDTGTTTHLTTPLNLKNVTLQRFTSASDCQNMAIGGLVLIGSTLKEGGEWVSLSLVLAKTDGTWVRQTLSSYNSPLYAMKYATAVPDPSFCLGTYSEGRYACADPTVKTIMLLIESVDFNASGSEYTCDFRTDTTFPATGILIPIDLAY